MSVASVLYFILIMCSALCIHTYVFYTWHLSFIYKRKAQSNLKREAFKKEKSIVSILCAMHNEEIVVETKLKSIFASTYSHNQVHIYIGTDQCTDQTVNIINTWKSIYPNIHLFEFKERQGKPQILNVLAQEAIKSFGLDQIFILTDANVFFDQELINELVSNHNQSNVGLVGANVLFKKHKNQGVSEAENLYNNRELKMKHQEGELWGCMMGAFGACYSMRADLWKDIPKGFIVEDFWLSMHVLDSGYKTLLCQEAIAYEHITGNSKIEYSRKVRMSSGNFQNLKYFQKLLWFQRPALSYAFWSHKVLRWLSPFFLILIYLSISCLIFLNQKQIFLFGILNGIIALSLLDFILEKKNIHFKYLRSVRHLIMMNIAILHGWLKFLKNKTSPIWTPTKRQGNRNVE